MFLQPFQQRWLHKCVVSDLRNPVAIENPGGEDETCMTKTATGQIPRHMDSQFTQNIQSNECLSCDCADLVTIQIPEEGHTYMSTRGLELFSQVTHLLCITFSMGISPWEVAVFHTIMQDHPQGEIYIYTLPSQNPSRRAMSNIPTTMMNL